MRHSAHRLFGHQCSPRTLREAVRVALMSGFLVVTAILAVLASRAGAQLFEAKLWQQDSQFADHFGRTVFFAGGTAVVTEPGEDETGTVHVYERVGTTWTTPTSLVAPDAADGSCACWTQMSSSGSSGVSPPSNTKMYPAPGAPTSSVPPRKHTAHPKPAGTGPAAGYSFAVGVQRSSAGSSGVPPRWRSKT